MVRAWGFSEDPLEDREDVGAQHPQAAEVGGLEMSKLGEFVQAFAVLCGAADVTGTGAACGRVGSLEFERLRRMLWIGAPRREPELLRLCVRID